MIGRFHRGLVLGVLACALVPATLSAQTTFLVGDDAQLRNAITNAAAGDTIRLQSNIVLLSNLPAVTESITIDGGGFTLSGADTFRGFVIQPGGLTPPISVAINDLTITNTLATGGAGADGLAGGGGGGGLGGALYVGQTATVTTTNVSISSSRASGGQGGSATGALGTSAGGSFGQGGGGGGGGIAGLDGSFGGGGGGGTTGGAGGYGAGGGGSLSPNPGGSGGAFGGNGGGGGGGGGAGLGGAIFVEGTLQVNGSLTINGSAVTAGAAGPGATAGQAFGNGIFLSGSGFLSIDTPAGSVSHIQDDIVDETGAGGGSFGFWGLDKSGDGTLILSGNNRYSLGTFVSGGTLQIGSSANIGDEFVELLDGTTLSITGDSAFSNFLFLSSTSRLNVAPGRSVTWNGLITDGGDGTFSGTLNLTGGGLLSLTGPNSYTNGTIVGGGSTLRVAQDDALGLSTTSITLGDATGSGALSIASGSSFLTSRSITLGATGGILDAQAGAFGQFDGAISGSGGLTKTGAGSILLNGLNTYTGDTTVSGGLLQLGRANILSSSAFLNVGAGATIDFGGFSQSANGLTGGGNVALGSATLTVGAGGGSSAFGGTISGTGSLIKTGLGVLTLTGPNAYSGGTLVSGGVLLGNTTSLQGSIVNNATVVFDQAADGMYAGLMSGTGALVKNGNGVLTLSGTNTYTGGTTVLGGTLAGTTSSIRGNILNNAAVLFDQAINGSYTGSISGTGSLMKSGSGTLVLGQANSHSGGTSVTGGVLRAGASGIFGSGGLFIGGGASVDLAGFDQSTSSLSGSGGLSLGSARLDVASGNFSGDISGSGSLFKSGPETLFLTGSNSYTGGTTVAGGALVGTTSSLQGAIQNDAFVVFDQGFDGTYAGTMTGSGLLEKTGSGALTVTGTLNHTGGTRITSGTLIDNTGALSGPILNQSAMTFGGTGNRAFDGVLGGSGLFTKAGTGTLSLSGNHLHTGTFAVTDGVLSIDGSIGSRFTVAPNATLRALGTLLGSVNAAGTLAVPAPPGSVTAAASPGNDNLNTLPVLTIGGDLDMTPGSRLVLPIGSGPNPTVLVGGRTTLNGTTIDLTPIEPLTQRATSFLALTSLNGLTLNDTNGASANPQYLPYLRPDGNSLFVTMLNFGIPLASSVSGSSSTSVGAAIDRLKNGATGDRFNVIRELTALSDEELEDALRQVSGETHASRLQYGIRDAELATDIVRRQIAARRREIRMGASLGTTWWAQLGGERTRLTNADGDRVGTIDIGSSVAGVDYRPSERWLFGFGGGYAGGSMSLTDLASGADVQAPRAFGYAGWNPKAFGLRGGGSFTRQQSETRRRIVFVARLPEELGGEPIGEGIDRQAEAEEVTLVSDQWSEWDREHEIKTYTLEWLVGIRRATFTRRTFTETGADSLSLLLPEQTVSLRQTNVVVNLWRREGNVRPFFEFLYRREITDGKTTTELEFPGEPDSRFFVDGLPAPKNITHFRGGTTWFSDWGTWTFEYQYRKATGQTTHSGDVRWRF